MKVLLTEKPNCDQEIYNNGKRVLMLEGCTQEVADKFTKEVSEKIGYKIDSYTVAGRVMVCCYSQDYYAVHDAICALPTSYYDVFEIPKYSIY